MTKIKVKRGEIDFQGYEVARTQFLISCEKTPIKAIFKEQKERTKLKKRCGRPRRNFPELLRTSVKDTPPYDSDSQVMALTYTVPSWVSSIGRTFMNANFCRITWAAQSRLIKELTELKDIADVMISMLNNKNRVKGLYYMENLNAYVPNVHFEQILIKYLVSNQEYQRNLSQRHINRPAANFDLYQINPIKASRRDGQNYVFNGQHTIEIVAAVSESRETPVWCMVYDDLEYTHKAGIFANQQKYVKLLSAYEMLTANLEADSDT